MLVYRKNLDRVLTSDEVDNNFSLVSQFNVLFSRSCEVGKSLDLNGVFFSLFDLVLPSIPNDSSFNININFIYSNDGLFYRNKYVVLSCSIDSAGVVSTSSSDSSFSFSFDEDTFICFYNTNESGVAHKYMNFLVMSLSPFDFDISSSPILYHQDSEG